MATDAEPQNCTAAEKHDQLQQIIACPERFQNKHSEVNEEAEYARSGNLKILYLPEVPAEQKHLPEDKEDIQEQSQHSETERHEKGQDIGQTGNRRCAESRLSRHCHTNPLSPSPRINTDIRRLMSSFVISSPAASVKPVLYCRIAKKQQVISGM